MAPENNVINEVISQAQAQPYKQPLERALATDEGFEAYLTSLAERPYAIVKGDEPKAVPVSPANIAETALARMEHGYKHCNVLRTADEIKAMGGDVMVKFWKKPIIQHRRASDGSFVSLNMWPDEAIARAAGDAGKEYNKNRSRRLPRQFDLANEVDREDFGNATQDVNIDALSPTAVYVFMKRYGLEYTKPERPQGLDYAGLKAWATQLAGELGEVCRSVDAKIRSIAFSKRAVSNPEQQIAEPPVEILTPTAGREFSKQAVEGISADSAGPAPGNTALGV